MKGSSKGITCLLVWLVAGQAALALQPLSYKAGETYTYDVESTLLAGIPELADQYSGFSIVYKLDLHMVSKESAVMKLRQVRTGKLNSQVPVSYEEDIDFHHTAAPEYERELGKPISIVYKQGLIASFKADKSEPIWSINIKRAILTNLQLDLTKVGTPVRKSSDNRLSVDPEALVYAMYEDGIGGECETRYNIFSVQSQDDPDMSEDVYNITKVKNYRNCVSRPKWETDNYDEQGCSDRCRVTETRKHLELYPVSSDKTSSDFPSGCPHGFQPDFHPVKSFSLTKYNVSGAAHQPIIEDIYDEGKTVYTLNGDEFLVVVQQNLTLVEVKPLKGAVPTIPNPVSYDSLAYELPILKEQEYLEFAFFSIFGPIQSEELIQVFMKKLEAVVEDIIPDDPQSSQYLGTKIIELSNAVIVMKEEDLEQIYEDLDSGDKKTKLAHKEQLMRKVFLDLLGLVGTNTSASYAIELIKAKRVSVSEAVELLEGIGKNVQEPSQELIEEVIALLDRPRVVANRVLFNSVALTIGKLIEEACVKPDIVPESSPRKSKSGSGSEESAEDSRESTRKQRDAPKKGDKKEEEDDDDEELCTEEQLKAHIRVIARRLANAQDLNKRAIYIEILAHMSSSLVLPILEPYVSGEAKELVSMHAEDAEFLRGIAIYALHHINDYYPEEVLPLVKRVYFDESEGYEIRTAAFTVIMESKPNLVLLERIASELWDEDNNQVSSFVYNYLREAANSTLPCERRLAQQAEIVLSHAPEIDIGIQYSNIFKYDYYDDERDYGVAAQMEYVASNVSNIPRSGYLSLSHISGPFQDDLLEIGFNSKGIDELLEKITRQGGVLSQILSQMGSNVQTHNLDNVLEMLKGKLAFNARKPDTTRASIYFNLFGRTNYLTLDEQFVLRILEDVVNWFREMDTSSGFSSHYVKVWMPSSFFKVVPSSIGFPVVVNHRNPVVFSIIIENARVASGDKKQVPLNGAFAFSTVIRPSIHVSTVVMAYAVSPAEDLLYGAAVERVYEMSAPAVINVAVDLKKDVYALSVKPKLPHRAFYHRTRPTTFQARAILIDVPKSEWLDSVNEIETLPEALKFDERYESKSLGLSVRVEAETEKIWANIPFWLTSTSYEEGIVAGLLEVLKNPGLKPREYNVYLEPHIRQPASEFVITLDYDRDLHLNVQQQQQQQSSDEDSRENKSREEEDDDEDQEELFQNGYKQTMTSIYGQKYSVPDAQKTVRDLIESSKASWAPALGQQEESPVPATISHTWKLTTVIKGSKPRHLAWQLIYAHTLDHRSIWMQVHGHKSAIEHHHQRPWKFCANMAAVFPQIPNPFYLEMSALTSQPAKLKAELGWGEDCTRDNQVIVMGTMEKTDEQMGSSSGVYLDSTKGGQQSQPWYLHQCQVHRAEGQTQSEACQLAISEAAQLNRVEFEIVARELSPFVLNITTRIDLALKSYLYPNMEVNPLADNDEDTLRIVIESIDQVADIDLTNVYIYKPTENVFFHKLHTPYYSPLSTLDSIDEIYGDMLMDDDYDASCNLMEDYVQTFDNVTYELPDNKCQYLLARDCSPDNSFTVLTSQIDLRSKTKALAIQVGIHTIKALPPKGEEFPVVINGQEILISSDSPKVLEFNTDEEVLIYVLDTAGPTDTPILVIESDDLSVQYDGKNAELEVDRDVKGDLCGLCGDFNEEWRGDFTGPMGCTWVDAEDFANSYAIKGQSCPVPPKPTGSAFCPNAKLQWIKNNRNSSATIASHHQQQESREEDETSNESRMQTKPIHAAQAMKVKVSKKQIVDSSSSEEDSSKETTRPLVKPEGRSECIKQVTDFVEIGQLTCFTVKPIHRCSESCKSVGRPRTVSAGVHCLESGKSFVADLKAQSKRSVVPQLLNKRVDRQATFNVPQKCM